MILSLPRVPRARVTPRSLHPDQFGAAPVTLGWLLDAVAQHRLPSPGRISEQEQFSDNFRLSFDQEHGRAPTASCRTLQGPAIMRFRQGDVVGLFEHAIVVSPAGPRPLVGPPLLFAPSSRMPVVVVGQPGLVRLRPTGPFFPPRVCVGRVR
jgi:hypothetical protein